MKAVDAFALRDQLAEWLREEFKSNAMLDAYDEHALEYLAENLIVNWNIGQDGE